MKKSRADRFQAWRRSWDRIKDMIQSRANGWWPGRGRNGPSAPVLEKPSGRRPLSREAPSLSVAQVQEALRRGREALLGRQHPDGYWVFELECDVSVTADWILLMHIVGTWDPARIRKAAEWILRHQNSDGGWPIYHGGPSELNASLKCYVALRMAGLSSEEPRLKAARRKILWLGGVMRANVFTKVYLAMLGLYDWKGIPAMPVEIIFFPRWAYLNIYELSYWARTIVVPLLISVALRPRFPVEGLSIEDLYLEPAEDRKYNQWNNEQRPSWRNLFVHNVYLRLDALLKILERYHPKPLRQAAIRKATHWMLERFKDSGGLGAIWPAMMNSTIALKALGYSPTSGPMLNALRNIDSLTLEDERVLRVQPCFSPVWDTGLAMNALLCAGCPKDDPALQAAAKWLLAKQVRKPGDWRVKLPKPVPPGGWYFEFENEFYPDVDDTAVVLMALHDVHYPETSALEGSIRRGLEWIFGMQNPDGGWGAFDYTAKNKEILNQLPFATPFWGALLDPSTADVTARCVEMMGRLGFSPEDPRARRAVDFLIRQQEPEGPWYGRWGVNYIYGTWSVLQGLRSIGSLTPEIAAPAVRWLREHQNADGGWGESCISYDNPAYKGLGRSTPSQTAWALLALVAAGEASSPEAERGVQYLLSTQEPDGLWSEEEFTGTGFPRVFYLRYHGYPKIFPVMALGRWLHARSASEAKAAVPAAASVSAA